MIAEIEEFREIGHSGGRYTVNTKISGDGKRSYQVGVRTEGGGGPWRIFGVHALPQGIPVGVMDLSWRPDLADQAPRQSPVYPVFIASDREGYYGHECLACKKYWRSSGAAPGTWPLTCPYCGLRASAIDFLTHGQRRFVERCCQAIEEAMYADQVGEHTIDMDAIADEIAKGATRPPFFYVEESQQCRFACPICDARNDILGKFGYCCGCGWRNNAHLLDADLTSAKASLHRDDQPSDTLRKAVSDFESACRDLVDQLLVHAGLTIKRRNVAEGIRFHDADRFSTEMESVFGIDLLGGFSEEDRAFLRLMFARRHVFEHRAGVVDQLYLEKSGDREVRLGQAIRENKPNVFRFLPMLNRMMKSFHEGFQEVLPIEAKALEFRRRRDAEMKNR